MVAKFINTNGWDSKYINMKCNGVEVQKLNCSGQAEVS